MMGGGFPPPGGPAQPVRPIVASPGMTGRLPQSPVGPVPPGGAAPDISRLQDVLQRASTRSMASPMTGGTPGMAPPPSGLMGGGGGLENYVRQLQGPFEESPGMSQRALGPEMAHGLEGPTMAPPAPVPPSMGAEMARPMPHPAMRPMARPMGHMMGRAMGRGVRR